MAGRRGKGKGGEGGRGLRRRRGLTQVYTDGAGREGQGGGGRRQGERMSLLLPGPLPPSYRRHDAAKHCSTTPLLLPLALPLPHSHYPLVPPRAAARTAWLRIECDAPPLATAPRCVSCPFASTAPAPLTGVTAPTLASALGRLRSCSCARSWCTVSRASCRSASVSSSCPRRRRSLWAVLSASSSACRTCRCRETSRSRSSCDRDLTELSSARAMTAEDCALASSASRACAHKKGEVLR